MAETRGYGPRALAALLPRIAAPALRRRGFTAAEIVTRWADIVGPVLAADSMPERLVFSKGARTGATLHLQAAGPLALEIQHLEPVVIERINNYCGYAAVARLAISQGPVRRRSRTAARRALETPDPARIAALERRTRGIETDALRAALNRLGNAVESARRTPK